MCLMTYIALLYRTRIHPEDERLARKMASDALDYEENLFKQIMLRPRKLGQLGMFLVYCLLFTFIYYYYFIHFL